MSSNLDAAGLAGIVLAAVVGLLLAYVLLSRILRNTNSSGGWSILLVGPCNAGKTALFLRMKEQHKEMKETVTSMQPNSGVVSLGKDGGQCHVVDLPGHPRLASYFDKEVTKAKGIVMVVDSMDFNGSKDEAARHMYRLLTSPVIRGRGIPILVACNKSDGGAKAHSVDFIRKRLEKLLYDVYTSDTGNSGLDSIGNEEEREHNILTGSGDAFSFSDLAEKRRFHRPLHVSFEKISVKENDIDAVRAFCQLAI